MKDIRGKEVKVGDFVGYAAREGDVAVMNTGYVADIDDEGGRFKVWRGLAQTTTPWLKVGNWKGNRVLKVG